MHDTDAHADADLQPPIGAPHASAAPLVQRRAARPVRGRRRSSAAASLLWAGHAHTHAHTPPTASEELRHAVLDAVVAAPANRNFPAVVTGTPVYPAPAAALSPVYSQQSTASSAFLPSLDVPASSPSSASTPSSPTRGVGDDDFVGGGGGVHAGVHEGSSDFVSQATAMDTTDSAGVSRAHVHDASEGGIADHGEEEPAGYHRPDGVDDGPPALLPLSSSASPPAPATGVPIHIPPELQLPRPVSRIEQARGLGRAAVAAVLGVEPRGAYAGGSPYAYDTAYRQHQHRVQGRQHAHHRDPAAGLPWGASGTSRAVADALFARSGDNLPPSYRAYLLAHQELRADDRRQEGPGNYRSHPHDPGHAGGVHRPPSQSGTAATDNEDTTPRPSHQPPRHLWNNDDGVDDVSFDDGDDDDDDDDGDHLYTEEVEVDADGDLDVDADCDHFDADPRGHATAHYGAHHHTIIGGAHDVGFAGVGGSESEGSSDGDGDAAGPSPARRRGRALRARRVHAGGDAQGLVVRGHALSLSPYPGGGGASGVVRNPLPEQVPALESGGVDDDDGDDDDGILRTSPPADPRDLPHQRDGRASSAASDTPPPWAHGSGTEGTPPQSQRMYGMTTNGNSRVVDLVSLSSDAAADRERFGTGVKLVPPSGVGVEVFPCWECDRVGDILAAAEIIFGARTDPREANAARLHTTHGTICRDPQRLLHEYCNAGDTLYVVPAQLPRDWQFAPPCTNILEDMILEAAVDDVTACRCVITTSRLIGFVSPALDSLLARILGNVIVLTESDAGVDFVAMLITTYCIIDYLLDTRHAMRGVDIGAHVLSSKRLLPVLEALLAEASEDQLLLLLSKVVHAAGRGVPREILAPAVRCISDACSDVVLQQFEGFALVPT